MTLHLSEAQQEYVAGLAQQLPADQRDTFIGAVQFRLGGRPCDIVLQRVASLIFRELQRGDLLRSPSSILSNHRGVQP
jgi:hypothetical protein